MRSVRRSVVLAVGVFGAAAFAIQASLAAPSQHVVQYQGRLADGSGVPLEGTINRLTFRLYSTAAPTSASFLWGEAHVSTPVRRGVFSVNLGAGALTVEVDGSTTSAPNPFVRELDGAPRYLQVQVDDQAPLAPLQQLGSVPYAVSAGGSVPVGGVIDWYRPSSSDPVPDGWVICAGQQIQDPDSPFFNKPAPDLVGKFVRGVADTPAAGADKPPIAGGQDTFLVTMAHSHGLSTHTHTLNPHSHTVTGNTDRPTFNANVPAGATVAVLTFGSTDHVHTLNGVTNSVGGTTGPAQGGTDGASPSVLVPTVPTYVGLLKIMRVR